jgi:hypothetical protein
MSPVRRVGLILGAGLLTVGLGAQVLVVLDHAERTALSDFLAAIAVACGVLALRGSIRPDHRQGELRHILGESPVTIARERPLLVTSAAFLMLGSGILGGPLYAGIATEVTVGAGAFLLAIGAILVVLSNKLQR